MRRRSAALLADAARQLTWRQALGRPRRLVPPRLLAGRVPARGAGRARGGRLEGAPAPRSGPLPPPSEDRVFRAAGHARSADDPELWSCADDGLLFLFDLHGFSQIARDPFWEEIVERW